ncbi:MAG: AEC family transporter [Ruminococcus flavefaciens]|nr:AEC family transporter [Ruminococcus flavefaciens]MCM1360926.1 AEC family transporter [Clostridiales bacterium]MCM1435602.1 AEC family transporter [Ruminococcus flavefaciens]
MSLTILKQTIIMLILITVGIVCSKTKIISKESNKDLSKFVLQVVNPVMIFMSYQTDYKPELVKNLLLTFVLSLGAYAVTILLAYLLIPSKKGRETELERFSAIYSNCGFMGIPLVNALFGMEGVFYLTAFITVFNLIVWTHGIILISGEKSMKNIVKVLYSPTIIAIVLGIITFFLQIRLHEVPAKALEFISQLNTPMAMIVSGVTMAETNVLKLLKKGGVYYICFLRLLLIPAILAALLSPLGISEKVRLTVIVAASAPPAAMCTLQCIRYGRNSVYASEIFTAGTILSVLTLPLVVEFTELLTKILA